MVRKGDSIIYLLRLLRKLKAFHDGSGDGYLGWDDWIAFLDRMDDGDA